MNTYHSTFDAIYNREPKVFPNALLQQLADKANTTRGLVEAIHSEAEALQSLVVIIASVLTESQQDRIAEKFGLTKVDHAA